MELCASAVHCDMVNTSREEGQHRAQLSPGGDEKRRTRSTAAHEAAPLGPPGSSGVAVAKAAARPCRHSAPVGMMHAAPDDAPAAGNAGASQPQVMHTFQRRRSAGQGGAVAAGVKGTPFSAPRSRRSQSAAAGAAAAKSHVAATHPKGSSKRSSGAAAVVPAHKAMRTPPASPLPLSAKKRAAARSPRSATKEGASRPAPSPRVAPAASPGGTLVPRSGSKRQRQHSPPARSSASGQEASEADEQGEQQGSPTVASLKQVVGSQEYEYWQQVEAEPLLEEEVEVAPGEGQGGGG